MKYCIEIPHQRKEREKLKLWSSSLPVFFVFLCVYEKERAPCFSTLSFSFFLSSHCSLSLCPFLPLLYRDSLFTAVVPKSPAQIRNTGLKKLGLEKKWKTSLAFELLKVHSHTLAISHVYDEGKWRRNKTVERNSKQCNTGQHGQRVKLL